MDRETTTNKSPGQLSTKLHLKPKLYIPSTLNIDLIHPPTPEGQGIQPAEPSIFLSFLELLKMHHCVLGHAVVGG